MTARVLAPGWPLGESESAGRIRDHDWAATSLGPVEGWPERLRGIVDLMLASHEAMFVAYGPDLVLVYNDACGLLLAGRHPDALGAPFRSAFPDAGTDLDAHLDATLAGHQQVMVDPHLAAPWRRDAPDTLHTATWTPLRDQGGAVAGFLATIQGATPSVAIPSALRDGEERQAYLLKLSDALRTLVDPVKIQETACRVLGERTGASRVAYGDVQEGRTVVTRYDHANGILSSVAALDAQAVGCDLAVAFRSREKVVFSDVLTDPRVTEADRRAFASIGVAANASLGLMKEGRWVAAMGLQHGTPRDWTPRDLALLEETAERTWTAIVRARSEAALRESEARFRTLAEGIPQLVWRAEDHGLWTWASPQWSAFTGQAETASHGWGWLEAVHPDDREAVRAAWEESRATGALEVGHRVRQAATGAYRFFQTRATPVHNEAGALVEWLGTSTDVQDLREMQTRQAALVAELQHRTRNLMGVVTAVTNRTLDSSTSLADFEDRIHDRLGALRRINGLLSRLRHGDRVSFDELIRTELMGHGIKVENGVHPQVRLHGPSDLRLRSSMAQTLALGVHELATNALRYGALSRPEGRLDVIWREVPAMVGERRLQVEWRESGVPVSAPGDPSSDAPADNALPPRRRGFGRELIERALPYQLKAETTYDLAPDGLRCTIILPISSAIDGGSARPEVPHG